MQRSSACVYDAFAGSGSLQRRGRAGLIAAVVTASRDELKDDATVLVPYWYGVPTQTREASSGGTNERACT